MINVNLLPPEYRRVESTPVARFIAIVIGAIVVTSGLVVYGYIHYSKLKSVRDLREQTEANYANKKKQADRSKSLMAEVKAYEARRKAITDVARGRILHSRKLDEFLDIIHNRGDKTTYFVWLERLSMAKPRETRRGGPSTGGAMAFQGFSESTEFSKITKLRDAIRKDAFFEDFTRVTRPIFKAVDFDDELEPKSAGRFQFTMELKPLGWQYAKKKPNKGKR